MMWKILINGGHWNQIQLFSIIKLNIIQVLNLSTEFDLDVLCKFSHMISSNLSKHNSQAYCNILSFSLTFCFEHTQ